MASFNRSVESLRRAILSRLSETGSVSAFDVRKNVKSVRGPLRGALVASAFGSLVREGQLVMTDDSVRNPDTHHNVRVYRAPTRRRVTRSK